MTTATAEFHPPKTVLGHPPGLLFLSFTETWERFSFYGMQALLTLYMVDQALTPGHIENILGMSGFRHGLEAVFGPMSIQALASQIFGLYTGFVYFTPLIGGWLGDQVLGQKKTVALGAVLMAIGHLLMAFQQSFLLALLMLILGSGCLKGNISAQVGALYSKADPARTSAFSLFNLGINIGAAVSPIVCGAVGQFYGWHYGFGLAALGMVAGLATYLIGGRTLPPDTLKPRGEVRPKLARSDFPVLGALAIVLVFAAFEATAYTQEFDVFNLWAQDTTSQQIFGWTMPVTWYPSFDGIFIIAFIPVCLRYWDWQVQRGRGTTEMTKIGWSGLMGAAGMASLTIASLIAAHGGKPGMGWAVFCFAAFALGFIYNWPTAMSLSSRVAPPAISGLMMGILFLTSFVSSILGGWLGAYYEKMSHAEFWAIHGLISATGTVLIWLFYKPLNRVLRAPPVGADALDDGMPLATVEE